MDARLRTRIADGRFAGTTGPRRANDVLWLAASTKGDLWRPARGAGILPPHPSKRKHGAAYAGDASALKLKMKRIYIILATLLLLAGLAIALAAYVRARGFSARTEPSSAEAFVARYVRSFAVPRSAREAKNPIVSSPEVLSQAMEHFADHCAGCHANDGSGDTPLGKGMSPRPPDMRQATTQNLTDGEIYYIIHNGIRFTGMPAFGPSGEAPDEDSWKMVYFIRHLPKISKEELEAMKSFNPTSPAHLAEEEQIRRFLAGEDIAPTESKHEH
jgi:mono/diheme cytochrome c family protein